MSASRPQTLDFLRLNWTAFESLCLRLARAQPNVQEVTAFGVQGDAQEGIDLLATLASGDHVAYQCKRVERFGPADIRDAVERFLGGTVAGQVVEFVLCTAAPLDSRALLAALEAARLRLGAVRLTVWDQRELSNQLKDRRPLVADLFGETTANEFNGPDLGWDAVGGLDVRYLVCKTSDLVGEIAAGDLSAVPGGPAVALASPVAKIQRALLDAYRYGRHDEIHGDAYATADAYRVAHPDAVADAWGGDNPYLTRTPSHQEVEDRVASQDPLLRLALGQGVPASDLVRVAAQYNYCGEDSFQETYSLAPMWGLYLQITNRSGTALHLDAVTGRAQAVRGDDVAPLRPGEGTRDLQQPGPGAPLAPGDSLLVPLATLVVSLASDEPYEEDQEWTERTRIGDRMQREGLGDLSGDLTRTWTLGPSFWPSAVSVRPVGAPPDHPQPQALRPFDPARLAVLDRMWGVGSCPHLFADFGDRLEYVRPLFTQTPGVDALEHVVAPPRATAFVLAELEFETTHLRSVTVDGHPVAAPATLERGDTLRVAVVPGAVVRFTGRYHAARPARHQPAFTRVLLQRYLAHRASAAPVSLASAG